MRNARGKCRLSNADTKEDVVRKLGLSSIMLATRNSLLTLDNSEFPASTSSSCLLRSWRLPHLLWHAGMAIGKTTSCIGSFPTTTYQTLNQPLEEGLSEGKVETLVKHIPAYCSRCKKIVSLTQQDEPLTSRCFRNANQKSESYRETYQNLTASHGV